MLPQSRPDGRRGVFHTRQSQHVQMSMSQNIKEWGFIRNELPLIRKALFVSFRERRPNPPSSLTAQIRAQDTVTAGFLFRVLGLGHIIA